MAAPVIVSIAPDSGYQDETTQIVITGTDFTDTEIEVTGVTIGAVACPFEVTDDTEIIATIPRYMALGAGTVTVTNTSDSDTETFTVLAQPNFTVDGHNRFGDFKSAAGKATQVSLTAAGSVPIYPAWTIDVTSATGAAAINATTALTSGFRLSSITLHASAALAAEDLVISVDALDGAAYDTVLATVAMDGLTNYTYTPTNDLIFEAGDQIVVTHANTGTKTYGLRIVCEVI